MAAACRVCGKGSTIVTDSRQVQHNGKPAIWRRRECLQCKRRYSTYEVLDNEVAKALPPKMDRVLWLLKELSKELEKFHGSD